MKPWKCSANHSIGLNIRFLLLIILLGACDVMEPYGVSQVHWVDGDSGEIDGERFRLAEVDAPEIRDVRWDAEPVLGEEARRYVQNLTRRGEVQVTRDQGFDRYDRRVIELEVDGQDLIDGDDGAWVFAIVGPSERANAWR